MDMLGFSLNLVSFLAITLTTGILVDDAIVEIENIVRHIQMGKSPYQAAIDAADEIGLAVIAISLTIVAIFTPASFMPGIAGQFFKQFGITVSVQVLFSLLAARLVTPMLAAYFLRHHHIEEKPPGIALRSYTRPRHLVGEALSAHRRSSASCCSRRRCWSITLLSKGFLPAQDSARSRLAIELPPGSQLADTEKATEEIVTPAARAPGDRQHLRRRRTRAEGRQGDSPRLALSSTTRRRRSARSPSTTSSSRSAARSRKSRTCATGSSTRTGCAPSPST